MRRTVIVTLVIVALGGGAIGYLDYSQWQAFKTEVAILESMVQGGTVDAALQQAQTIQSGGILTRHPEWQASVKVKDLIEEVHFQDARRKDTVADYGEFRQAYPNSRHAAAVEYYRACKLNTPQTYDQFLNTFPQDAFTGAATKRSDETWFAQALKSGTPEACEAYLRRWPMGEHVAEMDDRRTFLGAEQQGTVPGYENYCRLKPQGLFVVQAASRIDTLQYQAAKQADTAEAYDQYLKLQPKGQYAKEATEVGERAWYNQTVKQDTVEAFDLYLQRWPGGTHAQELEDKRAFNKARQENTIASYEQYLKALPRGRFADEAAGKVDELQYQNALRENTIAAYEQYLKLQPKGRFVGEAVGKADDLQYQAAAKVDTLEDYDRYLNKFPQGRHYEEAGRLSEEKWYTRAKTTDTKESYEAFLRRWPKGNLAVKGQEDLAFCLARKANTIAAYEKFLGTNPSGARVAEAKRELEELHRQLVAKYSDQATAFGANRDAQEAFSALLRHVLAQKQKEMVCYFMPKVRCQDWGEYSEEVRNLIDKVVLTPPAPSQAVLPLVISDPKIEKGPNQMPPSSLKGTLTAEFLAGFHKDAATRLTGAIEQCTAKGIVAVKAEDVPPPANQPVVGVPAIAVPANEACLFARYSVTNQAVAKDRQGMDIPNVLVEYTQQGFLLTAPKVHTGYLLGIQIDWEFELYVPAWDKRYKYSFRSSPPNSMSGSGYRALVNDAFVSAFDELMKRTGLKKNSQLSAPPPSGRTSSSPWDGKESIAEYAKRNGLDQTRTLDLGNGVKLELVLIPAGKFTMGSLATEKDRSDDETQHEVTISKPFYMGKYEVTQEQYEAIMGKNPSDFKGAKNPVEGVTWHDAQAFCQKLSQKSGRAVRLPTEAMWEYACRAGTTTRFHSGDTDSALDGAGWYDKNAGNTTHPVGQKMATAWGLFDMHGNLWEWCQDWYDAKYYANSPAVDPQGATNGQWWQSRVSRGGAWLHGPKRCRSAYRNYCSPGIQSYIIGFRVVVSSAEPVGRAQELVPEGAPPADDRDNPYKVLVNNFPVYAKRPCQGIPLDSRINVVALTDGLDSDQLEEVLNEKCKGYWQVTPGTKIRIEAVGKWYPSFRDGWCLPNGKREDGSATPKDYRVFSGSDNSFPIGMLVVFIREKMSHSDFGHGVPDGKALEDAKVVWGYTGNALEFEVPRKGFMCFQMNRSSLFDMASGALRITISIREPKKSR
jgi:formylglycine-generating enzyme required for sulfatase activity